MSEAFRPISLDLTAEPICEQLDRLDDAVFSALNGCKNSLSEVERLWIEAINTIDQCLLEETRAHYLKWAREVLNPDAIPLVDGPSRTARLTMEFLHSACVTAPLRSSTPVGVPRDER